MINTRITTPTACFFLLVFSNTSLALNKPLPPVQCYNYPIAKEFLTAPDQALDGTNNQQEHLWLGRIADYAIRQKRRLTFEIMIIAEQLAFKADYPAHALEQVKTSRKIPLASGDLGSFAVYMQINPRNLAQRDNLREFIEDELQQEGALLFASGRVKRLVTFGGQRYPLLTYSQISFGPNYKVALDPRPRLFRSDLPLVAGKAEDSQVAAICNQLKQCRNHWDQAAASSCD